MPIQALVQKKARTEISTEDAQRAAVNGDRKALEAVVRKLLPGVRNLVRYLVRGDADVDDIAQEALVAIVVGLPTFRGTGTLRAWTHQVTARVVFTAMARSRRAHQQIEVEADLTLVPGPDSPPDAYAERRHAVGLLDKIPDAQRHALVLHHVVGMTVPEIALVVGSPVETVRSRIRIGMERLRELHGDEE